MRQREETERHRECTRWRTGDLGISGWRLFVTSSHSHTNTPDFMTSCDPLRHCCLVLRDRGRAEAERKKSKMTKVKEMRDSEGVDTVQGQIMLRLWVTAEKGHTLSQRLLLERQEKHRVKSTDAYMEQKASFVKSNIN